MKCFSYHVLGIFALQLSTVFATGRRPYYGASKHEPKHEPAVFELDVNFENLRDAEVEILEGKLEEVLSLFVPAALAAAIKREDPDRIFPGMGDSNWSVVQLALVHLSSILYHDLTFIGGSGGMDSSELWENACAGGKRKVMVWHGHERSDGSGDASNTIAICPPFFSRADPPLESLGSENFCSKMDKEYLMGLQSSVLLRELAQTQHVGGGLGSRGRKAQKTAASGAQGVLRKSQRKMKAEPVDVESFTLYVILAGLRTIVCRS